MRAGLTQTDSEALGSAMKRTELNESSIVRMALRDLNYSSGAWLKDAPDLLEVMCELVTACRENNVVDVDAAISDAESILEKYRWRLQ
jgi:hypothetical protein